VGRGLGAEERKKNDMNGSNIGSLNKKQSGCAALFGLPFALVGVLALGWLLRDIWVVWQMSSWEEVPARILMVNLDQKRGRKSDTYRLDCRYSYEWQGQSFVGTRFSAQKESDNQYSFYEKWERKLRTHQRSREPFPCYVNPANPSESVLMRELRWWSVGFKAIFGLAFGGVGFAMIYGAFSSRKDAEVRKLKKEEFPNEPWLCKKEWADGKITSNIMSKVWNWTVFAVFWNTIAITIAFSSWLIISDEISRGNRAAYLVLIFPAVGVWLAWKAIRCWIIRYKFNPSVFHMATLPGLVGGALSGVVRMPKRLEVGGGFRVRLYCLNRKVVSSGGERSTEERVLWEDVAVLERDLLDGREGGIAVPVLFAIPYDLPASDQSNSDDTIDWKLTLSAEVPGVDYEVEFEVPVFKTPKSSPNFVLPETAKKVIEPLLAQENGSEQLRAQGVEVDELAGGGVHWRFGRCRAKGFALASVIVALVTGGVGVGLYVAKIPLIFSCGAGLFCLLFVWFLMDQLFYLSEVWADRKELKVVQGKWSLVETVFPAEKLESLVIREDGFVGEKRFYSLRVKTEDGKDHVLGRFLNDRALMNRMAERLIQIYPALKAPGLV